MLTKAGSVSAFFSYLCPVTPYIMKRICYILAVLSLFVYGCQKESNQNLQEQGKQTHLLDTAHVHTGIVSVKVTEQLAKQIETATLPENQVFAGLEVQSIRRSFLRPVSTKPVLRQQDCIYGIP